MRNQTWIIGGSGYSYIQNQHKVKERSLLINEDVIDYSKEYFTIEALEDGVVSFDDLGLGNVLQYSTDDCKTWSTLEPLIEINIQNNKKIYFKGQNHNIDYGICNFIIKTQSNICGNIMSLLYADDFVGKTDLSEFDEEVLSCLFLECSGIVNAKDLILPATTLSDGCYYQMFYNCSSLVTTPSILPATTLTYGCYDGMFYNCSSLITAPELPATTLTIRCYYQMFYGCSLLITAPELPATELADGCYGSMFHKCTSLTKSPELPATELADGCYGSMFEGCTSLTTAPKLPATTLAERCYYAMFRSCSLLTTAPYLPATTLTENCYNGMFWGCTSLLTVPELLATTLVKDCYRYMLCDCTNLNEITMLATDISADNCLNRWVDGVSTSGTFIKHKDMSSLPSGISGIPSGWTVVNYQE